MISLWRQKTLGTFCMIGSVILMILNLLDLWVIPSCDVRGATLSNIPGYTYPVIETERLLGFINNQKLPINYYWLKEANEHVFLAIQHGQRRLRIYENWLLWVLGKVYQPFGKTQNSKRIIVGRQAMCSEVSQVLKSITERAGLPSRFIGLNGHVVLEVRIANRWIVADPDYGVVYPVNFNSLQQQESGQLIQEMLQEKGYSQSVIDTYIKIVTSKKDNRVRVVGSPISPRLFTTERIAEWLKWLIPIGCLLGGIYLLKTNDAD